MTKLGEMPRSVRPKKAGNREAGTFKCFQVGMRDQGNLGPLGIAVHRKALEMSCAIQNQLARILAEFEMTLERDVLQPLSRLSEVTAPPPRSFPSFLLSLPPPDP